MYITYMINHTCTHYDVNNTCVLHKCIHYDVNPKFDLHTCLPYDVHNNHTFESHINKII